MFKPLLLTVMLLAVVATAFFLNPPPPTPYEDLGYTSSEDYPENEGYFVDLTSIDSGSYYADLDSIEEENIQPPTQVAQDIPTPIVQDPPAPVVQEEVAPQEQLAPLARSSSADLVGYQEEHPGVFIRDTGGEVIIRVSLDDPRVKFFVGRPENTMTVCSQLNKYGLQVAVNGSGFYANSGMVDPFGIVDGKIYSTSDKPGITIAVTDDNKVKFVGNGKVPDNTIYAITGFNRVVAKGKVADKFYPGHPDYKSGYGTVRPRTVISTDDEFLTIILFRSPRTVTATGEYILANFPDTTDVFNMDGGGSTNGCDSKLGPLVAETGRPVANVFGIYSP